MANYRVYYQHWGDRHIYRVPLDASGKGEEIIGTQDYLGGLSVSPDGKMLAVPVHEQVHREATARIALFQVDSSNPPRMLDATLYASKVQFTPDGKSVAYAIGEKGVGNVWVQPIDGSAGRAVTDFKSEQIWSFSLSPDGKNLAVLRGHWDSDVVLLQESK
ncbi:MAG TPA: hypothetical protein VIX91_19725 [Candidatus Acidoferrum sp.]